jgi:signal transduction histidine kinase
MERSFDRRHGHGRRRSDGQDALAMRGLLHDIGHEISAMSLLVDAVSEDGGLPARVRTRLQLLGQELERLRDLISHEMAGGSGGGAVSLRPLATQLTQLADAASAASVKLLPGPDATAEASPDLVWRVLSNVVGNAARAAGAAGLVTVEIGQDTTATIDVTDDGPGFGDGPQGRASLGLRVVTSLLTSCGGTLEISSPGPAGTHVRIALPRSPGTGKGSSASDRRAG